MDEDKIEQQIKTAMIDILMVLHNVGVRMVSAGAVMRLFGVPNDHAQDYDEMVFEITDNILTLDVEGLDSLMGLKDSNITLH